MAWALADFQKMEGSEEGIEDEVMAEADEAEAAAIILLIAAWTSSIFLLFWFCDTIVPLTTKMHFSFLVLIFLFNLWLPLLHGTILHP